MKHRESVRKFLYDALHKRKSEVPKEFKDLTDENLKLLCKEIEEQFFMTFNKVCNLFIYWNNHKLMYCSCQLS